MNASKLNVGGTPIINGTVGRILFQGASDTLGESANLFWDNTNVRLGVGGTPTKTFDITGSATSGFDVITFKGQYSKRGYLGNDNSRVYFSSGFDGTESYIYLSAANAILKSAEIQFQIGNTERMRINSNGNVLINTTTDAGYKLDVNGTARVSSIMAGTQTSISSGVKLESDTNIRAWNQLQLGQFNSTNLTSSQLQYTASGASGYMIANSTSHTATTGAYYALRLQNNIAPTSGTGVFNLLDIVSTINQTGGANGVTRGLYVNPTLTSAFEFRAIETTAGNVIFNGGSVGVGTTTPTGRNGYGGGTAIEVVNNSTYASFNLNGGNIASPTYFTLGAQGGGADIRVNNKPFQMTINSIDAFKISTTGNIGINTTTDAGFKLDVNGTARINGNLTFQTTAWIFDNSNAIMHRGGFNNESIAFNGSRITFTDANGFVFNSTNAGATLTASSILDIQSTTKGFLPPRMTNAQRTAIASPAVGLIVYCTDATEGLWIYKSSGWIFIV
jgi:hypothetical protein